MTEKLIAVVPTYIRNDKNANLTYTTIKTFLDTAESYCDLVVIDDCSPRSDMIDGLIKHIGNDKFYDFIKNEENQGFSRTINRGLQIASESGRDAILFNADMHFFDSSWIEEILASPGDIIGGRLIYPNDLIQHAGIYWSAIHYAWGHRYQFGPKNLPEALIECECPVTGALQLIRSYVLREIGLYDEGFRLSWEDVDYCCRAHEAGFEVIYQPKVCVGHYESVFRHPSVAEPHVEQWQLESWRRINEKWPPNKILDWVSTMSDLFGGVDASRAS